MIHVDLMEMSSYRYRLVWATKLSLAVIGLVFPVLVLGYNSFYCSMYHVPVPTLSVNLYDYIFNSYY